ncbi:MAG: hypothetical protein QOI54_1235 [Actinomycetota bacterium]|nr:hypothetical protein [Actinomycetota bacterium]
MAGASQGSAPAIDRHRLGGGRTARFGPDTRPERPRLRIAGMRDHEDAMSQAANRLARLLERRPELVTVDGEAPEAAVIRRDQLLVGTSLATRVAATIDRWVERREDVQGIGVTRLHLRGDADVTDLLAGRLALPGGASASPVHLFTAAPAHGGGPVGTPIVSQADTRRPPTTGAERLVQVALLDTGLGPHDWFPAGSWDQLGEGDVTDRSDVPTGPADDQTGHGTFLAGVVRRHAPTARLVVGRVLASDGVCDEVELITALHLLAARTPSSGRPVDVLVLGLGAFTWNDLRPAALARALLALGSDTVVVAAAGNSGRERPFWPAALAPVVSVGALTAHGARAGFSGHGCWVDAWAQGEDVTSSIVARGDEPAGQARWSGTSFAAARVSAQIAHRAATTGYSAAAVTPQVLADFAAPEPTDSPVPDGTSS